MRVLVIAALLTTGVASAEPLGALGYDNARHLLARTGFGPTDAEVTSFAKLSRDQAVDKILGGMRADAITPPLAWLGQPNGGGVANRVFGGGGLKDEPLAVRHAVQAEIRDRAVDLSTWWYREMLTTPSPLTERMVLFWHGHFVSSVKKVHAPVLMYRQNVLFRKYALGNFRTLLHEVAHDPAMLVYLDGAANKRGQPNENFAREVMELFTLGEGRYSEADVKEAARAFTGWSIDRVAGAFRFRPRLHDDGVKSVLGLNGPLDGDAVLDRLLEQPSCAPFIVRKLWRTFVSPDVDEKQVDKLAKLLREGNWELAPVMRAMLTSDAFYAAKNRGTLVKSPVELIVGTLRQLDDSPEQPPSDLLGAVVTGAQLGQAVFAPPNVKGWPGGDAFIDANTLLLRKQFLSRIARDSEATMAPRAADSAIDLSAFNNTLTGDNAARIKRARQLLLPLAPVVASAETQPVPALRQLLFDPAYQLK